MPGRNSASVVHEPTLKREEEGEVKTHYTAPEAKVSKLFPNEGYGFIEMRDGRGIYFHKNSVFNASLLHLHIGDDVTFFEEAGDEGPRAITIRPAGKHQECRKSEPERRPPWLLISADPKRWLRRVLALDEAKRYTSE